MFYEFEKEDGTIISESFPMGKCPKEIVCEDGQKAKKIFSLPYIVVKGSSSEAIKKRDNLKRREEVEAVAQDLGMANFIPLKKQSPNQQLMDLQKNKTKFHEQMCKSQEETVAAQAKKVKAAQEKARSSFSVEKYLKRKEAGEKRAAKERAITL